MTGRSATSPRATPDRTGSSVAALALDVVVGRLLRIGTIAAVSLMAIGVVLMAVNGISPTDRPFPPLDINQIVGDILALRPEGFLWLGLITVILTPISRVTASLLGYIRAADRTMTLISIATLAVIGASIVISSTVQ